MRSGGVLIALMLFAACARGPEDKPAPRAASREEVAADLYPPEFHETWGTGRKEQCRYDLTIGRQKSEATASFQQVRLSNSRRVETEREAGDAFSVMRMNLIRQPAAGLQEMISVFAALTSVNKLPTGTVSRISFSRQSQDGHEWGQLLMHSKSASHSWHSFRESEADGHRLLTFRPDLTVPEDALPLCARRIAHPILRLGQRLEVKIITSLAKLPLDTVDATLSLSEARRTTIIPAGAFRTHTFTARWKSGLTKVWEVETEPPHRIIRWHSTSGETAELAAAN